MPTAPIQTEVSHVLASQVSLALERHAEVRKELAILLILKHQTAGVVQKSKL